MGPPVKPKYRAAPSKPDPVYVPAPKPYHKPPIIIYQGVRPPVHVYEKPPVPQYVQKKSDNTETYLSGSVGNSIKGKVPTKLEEIEAPNLGPNTQSRSTSVSASIRNNYSQPRAEARIDTSDQISTFHNKEKGTSAIVRAVVSVSESENKLIRPGTVTDITNEK